MTIKRFVVTTLTVFLSVFHLNAQLKEPIRFNLHSGWMFREANTGKWMNATVPGCVHTDLMANGVIDDVFKNDNAEKARWIETKDWEYKTSFTADDKVMAREFVDLIFEGLDTYADVYVNENKVLEAANMFTGYTVNIKTFLTPGPNTLRIYFHSAVNHAVPLAQASNVRYPADNDESEFRTSVFTRKAA